MLNWTVRNGTDHLTIFKQITDTYLNCQRYKAKLGTI